MIKKIVKKFTPQFVIEAYYYMWALLGASMFGFPSKKLIVIGVTGTSGKSTTVDFITRILEENGEKVASLSSIRFKIGSKESKNELKMTMPGRFVIQKFLRQAVNEKCKYAVLEVTSEGIRQFRHKFIDFNTAVFNNLTPEHIESHGGFENYRNEKLKLFKATNFLHIINTDDLEASHFLKIQSTAKWGFGLKTPSDDIVKIANQHCHSQYEHLKAEQVIFSNTGISFSMKDVPFELALLGQFNIYNALAAICVGLSQGVSLETCKNALAKVSGILGRMEVVSNPPAGGPLVVVDYAHTPEQLELAYKSLAPKNLVCVLGSCGGGRDKWKRPVLGQVAERYCKEIIITNEDPYDEDPLEIMQQVAEGVGEKPHSIVMDRKEAIKKALELAKNDETIIITGKGSEIWMALANGKKIPWSDKETVKSLVNIDKAS